MRFKNRKTSVMLIALMAVIFVTQMFFSGIDTPAQGKNPAVKTADAGITQTDFYDGDDTDLITEEEVVSADLNVVYRSTLTSTEVVDEFEGNIDKGDFDNKIVSYTVERLCIYKEPDYKAEVLGVMYSGSEADIVEQGEEWTKVTSGGITGYVKNAAVLFGDEAKVIAEIIGEKEAVAGTDKVTVYTDTSCTESEAEIPKGKSVEINDEDADLLFVSYDGIYGYVKRDQIDISYGLKEAISIEVEKQRQAEEAAEAAREAAKKAAEAAAKAEAAKNNSIMTSVVRPSFSATEDEIHLLAAVVYWESSWEPKEGQLAVANVVLNRVKSSKFKQNSIKSVIYAPGQFSGVSQNGGPTARFQNVLNMSNEQLNVRGSYDAAVKALSGQNNIGDLLFFIGAKKANFARYSEYTVINNHCFYVY